VIKESRPLLGGVELGGTKCVCLVGSGPDDVRAQVEIPTGTDPRVTLARIEAELRQAISKHGPIKALGVASFGPVDCRPSSATFGWITSTTKPGWSRTAVGPWLSQAFEVPLGFDTDVNGAALAEGRWGAARGLADFAYITVGTGVGVGLIVNGCLVHGFMHPELGHIRAVRAPGDDWPGACAYHGACVEGLASGPAIAARAGTPPHLIPPDSPIWDLTAHALSQLLHTLVAATAPLRILVGGGVLQARPQLIPAMRRELVRSLNGYIDSPALSSGLDDFVMAPGLGGRAGPLGALALAADALKAARLN
jgi:fructokinase